MAATSANGTPAADFGSLTGKADITIDNDAVITGNIYASGQGYTAKGLWQGKCMTWMERPILR